MTEKDRNKEDERDHSWSSWIKYSLWGMLVLVIGTPTAAYFYTDHLWQEQLQRAKEQGYPTTPSGFQKMYRKQATEQKPYSDSKYDFRKKVVEGFADELENLRYGTSIIGTLGIGRSANEEPMNVHATVSWAERKQAGKQIYSILQPYQPRIYRKITKNMFPPKLKLKKGPELEHPIPKYRFASDLFSVSNILGTYAKVCLLQNCTDAYHKVVDKLVDLSELVQKVPIPVSFLSGISIERKALRLIEFSLATKNPSMSVEQVNQLLQSMKDLPDEEKYLNSALKGNFYLRVVYTGKRLTGELSTGDKKEEEDVLNQLWNKLAKESPMRKLLGPLMAARAAGVYMKTVSAMRGPTYQNKERMRQLNQRIDEMKSGPISRLINQLAMHIFYALEGISEAVDEIRARRELTRIALRMKKHRLQTGRFPKMDLSDSVDPFSGAPYKKTETEKQLILYSVGENGEDNGGKYYDYPDLSDFPEDIAVYIHK